MTEAVDAAWRRAVASAEATGNARRAQADQVAAGSLWAAPPSLEMSHRDDRWQSNRGARETEVGVAMPLWLPGQRAARQDAAQADVDAASAATLAARHRLAGIVREAAWDVTLQRAEVGLAQAQLDAASKLSTDVERRVAAGDMARADGLAARGETLAATAALAQAKQKLTSALSAWSTLTGLSATVPLSPTEGAAAAPDLHPALRAAGLNLELARKRLDAVRASRASPPELIARVRQDVSGRNEPTSNSVGLGIRIPFGTSARNEPLLAAALTEADVAEVSLQQLRAQVQADIDTANAAEEAARLQLDAETARATALRERATLVEKSFRAGETPLPEALRAISAAQQAEAAAKRQEAALGLARSRLQQAMGITP
jgi:outer membrane protein, heavy metal efflux system